MCWNQTRSGNIDALMRCGSMYYCEFLLTHMFSAKAWAKWDIRTMFTCIRKHDIRIIFRPINLLDHHMRTSWFPILFLHSIRYFRGISISLDYTFVYRLTCNKSAQSAASARRHWENCLCLSVNHRQNWNNIQICVINTTRCTWKCQQTTFT